MDAFLRHRARGELVEALKCLRIAVDGGSGQAMWELGRLYSYGAMGLEEDWERANTYYEMGAIAGYAPAMVSYALCLQHGEGVQPNEEEAILWAVKAISTQDPYAVAFCEEFGLAVERDEVAAVRHYTESAGMGFSAAQYRLGLLLTENENDVDRTLVGRQWLQQAAQQGR